MADAYNDDGDIDVEAERRLQSSIMGLKQQADQLMMTDKFDDAIRLYRGLLVHLTKSQVKMVKQKDLVISCRMNVLGAMSKLEQWREIPPECEHVFEFLQEIKDDLEKTMTTEQLQAMHAQILGRVFYFRGFALLRLGAFAQADNDFRIATQMLPNVEAIKEDWKQAQAALMLENKVKELMNTAMGHFQTNNFEVAAKMCEEALEEANKLQKHELTALIHGNLAAAYTRAEKDDEALKHYNSAIDLTKKLDPANSSDRLFDLMEAATSIHMRRNDLQAAYAVLKKSVTLFSKCKERQDREHPHFLNVGRVCFALEKFAEAEKHFNRSEKAASAKGDIDGSLHLMSWLGKVYTEQKQFDKLSTLLDKAFAITTKEKKDDLHGLFLLLWLPLLEEKASKGETISDADINKLWEGYHFFGHKRVLTGLLRSALLLVVLWQDSEENRAKRDQILDGVEAIKIQGLFGPDAAMFAKLAFVRADVAASRGDATQGFNTMKHVLLCLKRDESMQELRSILLRRLAELYVMQRSSGESDDDESLELLSESLGAMRSAGDDASVPTLSSVLVRVSQWEAQKANGNISRADELLDESAKLLKAYKGDDGKELLCQTLVGQCVLQLKRGNTSKAKELMNEIDSFPFAAAWTHLAGIRAQLNGSESKPTSAAKTEPASPKKAAAAKAKKPEVPASSKSLSTEPATSAHNAAEVTTTIATASAPGTLAALWEEYWFALAVTLVAIIFAIVMMQDQEQAQTQE